MTKITVHADCGNAPMKELLRDLNIAYVCADVEAILEKVSEDVSWQIVGQFEMRGKDEVRAALQHMNDIAVSELVIENIMTHGRDAAIHGLIISDDGKRYAFCDVCQFASASGKKIDLIKSYTIEINMEG